MKKSFLYFLAIILVLIFLIFLHERQVSRWKVYTNTLYGFELKVPPDFLVKDNSNPRFFSISVVDLKEETQYLSLYIYKGRLESDIEPQWGGPFPTKIPANEKNGEIMLVERKLNDILGVEDYGVVDEGHDYADSFNFEKGEYVWEIRLDPIAEGRGSEFIENKNYGKKFDMETYREIRDSFHLI